MVKEAFEDLKSNFAPDLILTHHDDDRHQDHRLVSQLTWNTWRDHMILEYEIMKYDGDLGRPNFYVPLSEDICRDKIAGLFEAFPSQAKRQWFDEQTFWSLLRLRGSSQCSSRLAEAFFVEKSLPNSVAARRAVRRQVDYCNPLRSLPTNSSETDFVSSSYY